MGCPTQSIGSNCKNGLGQLIFLLATYLLAQSDLKYIELEQTQSELFTKEKGQSIRKVEKVHAWPDWLIGLGQNSHGIFGVYDYRVKYL